MVGCDFNDNIPQIGVMKGFALIEKYITIENIKKAIGKAPKNYERSIEIFTILEEGLIEKAKNEEKSEKYEINYSSFKLLNIYEQISESIPFTK